MVAPVVDERAVIAVDVLIRELARGGRVADFERAELALVDELELHALADVRTDRGVDARTVRDVE